VQPKRSQNPVPPPHPALLSVGGTLGWRFSRKLSGGEFRGPSFRLKTGGYFRRPLRLLVGGAVSSLICQECRPVRTTRACRFRRCAALSWAVSRACTLPFCQVARRAGKRREGGPRLAGKGAEARGTGWGGEPRGFPSLPSRSP